MDVNTQCPSKSKNLTLNPDLFLFCEHNTGPVCQNISPQYFFQTLFFLVKLTIFLLIYETKLQVMTDTNSFPMKIKSQEI